MKLFSAVLTRYLESFSTQFHSILLDFDDNTLPADDSIHENRIKELFEFFPKSDKSYIKIVENLLVLTKNGQVTIVNYLLEVFNKLLTPNSQTPFSVLESFSTIYDSNNKYHKAILFNFSLFFISDLICQIVIKSNFDGISELLIKSAFSICIKDLNDSYIHPRILKNWALVLSSLSVSCFDDIVNRYKKLAEDDTLYVRTYQLISYIRLDCNKEKAKSFLEFVFDNFKFLRRKSKLTSEIYSSLSYIFESINFETDVLEKIYELIYKDTITTVGGYELICILYIKLPSKIKQFSQFISKYVYTNYTDRDKAKLGIKLFRRILIGGYMYPYIKGDYSSLTYLQCFNRNMEREFLPETFTTKILLKSKFDFCPSLFRKVLLHVISYNTVYFKEVILDRFMSIDDPTCDSRFSVLLSIIPTINSDEFNKYSMTKLSEDFLLEINNKVKGRIMPFLSFEHDNENTYITHSDDYSCVKKQVYDSNIKIQHFIETTETFIFKPLKLSYNICTNRRDFFTYPVQVLRAIPIIFNQIDFLEEGFIKEFFLLNCSESLEVSSAARELLFFISKKPDLYESIIKVAIDVIMSGIPTKETLFTCIAVLLNVFNDEPKNLSKDLIYDVEMVAFIGFTSTQPGTRILSYSLLCSIGDMLDHGVVSYLKNQTNNIENCVKIRLVHQMQLSGIKKAAFPLPWSWVYSSDYYDLWLVYIAEILDVIVFANYTPIIQRFRSNIQGHINKISNLTDNDPSQIAYILLYLSAHVRLDLLNLGKDIYKIKPFEPYSPVSSENNDSSFSVLYDLLKANEEWKNTVVFTVIRYLNYTMLSNASSLIYKCSENQITMGAASLCALIYSPSNSDKAISIALPDIIYFMSGVHLILLNLKLNALNYIKWTEELENTVIKYNDLVCNYCIIFRKSFRRKIEEHEWSVHSRELMMRFLVNWIRTESPELEKLRKNATDAIVSLVSTGSIFSESQFFDSNIAELFASIEVNNSRVLASLIMNHAELIIDTYCLVCLTSKRPIADLYFENISLLFAVDELEDIVSNNLGALLLVGYVFEQLKHTRTESFMKSLEAISQQAIPDVRYEHLTECIFQFAFRVIKQKSSHSPYNEIFTSLKNIVEHLRLLPNANSCIKDAPQIYKRFTPVQFLNGLMEATECIEDDHFESVAQIWHCLLQKTDNELVVPLFIFHYPNLVIKKNLLSRLIAGDAPHIVEKLTSRCSFSFYYHIISHDLSFVNELWIIPLLIKAFEKRKKDFIQNIAQIAHFAFLFYDIEEAKPLLLRLCRYYYVEPPLSDNPNDIIDCVKIFADKITDHSSDDNITKWGTEALKWFFASNNLSRVILSLKIYNIMLRPVDETIIQGLIKTVHFNIKNNMDSTLVYDLIQESLVFFLSIFEDHMEQSFGFASAFLDCPSIPRQYLSCVVDIFTKAVNNPLTRQKTWSYAVSIVRIMSNSFETNDQFLQILEDMIKFDSKNEFMLVALPFKQTFGGFASIKSIDEILKQSSQTHLCKAIDHYSLIIESASTVLSDSIFGLAASILEIAHNENICNSLKKLYNAALQMLDICPNAIKFITIVAEKEPSVSEKSSVLFMGWERTLDDVVRELHRMSPATEHLTTITDCTSLSDVLALRECLQIPKILPFAAEQETIDVLINSKRNPYVRRKSSVRRNPNKIYVQDNLYKDVDCSDFLPLTVKESFIGTVYDEKETNYIMQADEFIRSEA